MNDVLLSNTNCHSLIDKHSQGVSWIWALIYPRQPVEKVRLSSSEKDKAIEVCLKSMDDQSDPKLICSEGYKNSLGLSIFLALANQCCSKTQACGALFHFFSDYFSIITDSCFVICLNIRVASILLRKFFRQEAPLGRRNMLLLEFPE